MIEPNVLFPYKVPDHIESNVECPDFFSDIYLDQVFEVITSHKQEYNLKPFYFSPLHDLETIYFRQEIFRDLEDAAVYRAIKSFAETMSLVRRYQKISEKSYYKYHQEGWFLEAVSLYCKAIIELTEDLSALEIKSTGIKAILAYLKSYKINPGFIALHAETQEIKSDLSGINYCLIIKGSWIGVRKYEAEIDYSVEVENTFEKFKQGEVKNYRIDLTAAPGMNHVQAQIVDCVSKLYPEIFKKMDTYYQKYSKFWDEVIISFDRQIQFFVGYLDHIREIKEMGLPFCYPELQMNTKEICATNSFDIALATKLMKEKLPVICNDFYLKGKERIIIVSGPNQGGKTTFARMFGQLHYLASLGCPVPGDNATLFLCDRIFTHFEREEDIKNLRGKLQDDLIRIHSILDSATSDSLIIMNEIFTSTALQDAIFLSTEIIERIIQLDALCVCVSFIDEISLLGAQVVSMVSTVQPDDPTQRTFKVIRKPSDGRSYAICIAEKHHLTYDQIKERITE